MYIAHTGCHCRNQYLINVLPALLRKFLQRTGYHRPCSKVLCTRARLWIFSWNCFRVPFHLIGFDKKKVHGLPLCNSEVTKFWSNKI